MSVLSGTILGTFLYRLLQTLNMIPGVKNTFLVFGNICYWMDVWLNKIQSRVDGFNFCTFEKLDTEPKRFTMKSVNVSHQYCLDI